MSYQYLYCASCGVRRTGHGYQCSVCGNLLRHDTRRAERKPNILQTTTRWQAPVEQRQPQPIAA